jgi:low-affinity ferrous iron transport protein
MKASIFPAREPIFAAAPTQRPGALAGQFTPPPPTYSSSNEKNDFTFSEGEISLATEVTSAKKPNALDKITRAAGSPIVFFVMLVLIGFWVVMGLIYGTNDTWQIMIQNASSIQVYLTDILLIRQQQNAGRALMTTLAELQSRNATCERLLGQIPNCQWMETHKDAPKQLMLNGRPVDDELEESLYMVTGQPTRFQYVWTKMCHASASAMGSIYAYIFYWIGIFAWVGIGPIFQFSDTWQLWVNTATAISLTITSVFLQNIQQQQEDTLEKCLEYALKVDAEVEYRLRELTEDIKPNPIHEIPAPKPTKIERGVDNFADVMGSGLGVALTILVFVAWIAVGPVLTFDDNWWLIIGTFTGLVGFIDAFVLRNMYSREEKAAGFEFRAIQDSDERLLDRLNVPLPQRVAVVRPLTLRISIAIGDACGSQWASVSAVLFVIALLVLATAMLWSTVSLEEAV